MLEKRHTAALVAFLCFSIGGVHGADLSTDYSLSYKDGPGGSWVVTLGGYGAAEPAFPGSKKYDFAFVPIIDIHRAGERDWLTLPLDAASITLYQSGNFRAGVAGNYILDRNHNDDSAARGLHDINYTLQAGVFAEYYPTPFLRTRVEVLQGFTGSDGLLANFSADFIYKPNCCWQFTAGPRLQFANTQYESSFFSVSGIDVTRSGLPAFHASGGLASAGVDATVRYNISERLSLRAFADWERLTGDGADSPIVKLRGSQDQFEVGIGASYMFNYRP